MGFAASGVEVGFPQDPLFSGSIKVLRQHCEQHVFEYEANPWSKSIQHFILLYYVTEEELK